MSTAESLRSDTGDAGPLGGWACTFSDNPLSLGGRPSTFRVVAGLGGSSINFGGRVGSSLADEVVTSQLLCSECAVSIGKVDSSFGVGSEGEGGSRLTGGDFTLLGRPVSLPLANPELRPNALNSRFFLRIEAAEELFLSG